MLQIHKKSVSLKFGRFLLKAAGKFSKTKTLPPSTPEMCLQISRNFTLFISRFTFVHKSPQKPGAPAGRVQTGGKRAAGPLNSEPIFIPAPLTVWPGECTLPSLSVDTGMIIHSFIEFDHFHNLNETSTEPFLSQILICGFWSTRILHYFPLSIFCSCSVTGVTSHIFSGIRWFRTKRPYIFWKQTSPFPVFQSPPSPPTTHLVAPQCSPVQPFTAQYSPCSLIQSSTACHPR